MTFDHIRRVYTRIKRYGFEGANVPTDYISRPRGMVVWDMSACKSWMDNHSFLDALHRGLAFTETKLSEEWLIVGPSMMITIRSLMAYKPPELVRNDGEFYSGGWLGRVEIFYRYTLYTKKREDPFDASRTFFDEWYCGCESAWALGITDRPLHPILGPRS